MPEIKVSELYIYPVKSLGGISLQASEITTKGLKHDRRWMVVDTEGRFLTQRTHPEMALLKTKMENGQLFIFHKAEPGDLLEINPGQYTEETLNVTVWDDTVKANIVGARADKWISGKLGMKCRLVYMPESSLRKVDIKYAHNDETVGFADAFPYLLIGQASLDDLNLRLEKQLPMDRFRPNIVFSGGSAYEEDEWESFTAGDAEFSVVKPCSRCVITTTDQETTERAKEPLATLATYRNVNGKIMFGQNLTLKTGTRIALGDRIAVRRNQNSTTSGFEN